MEHADILTDKRPVRRLVWEDNSVIAVGLSGVDKIEAYGEPGEFRGVPWFAVYEGPCLVRRVNAATVSIVEYEV